MLYKSLFVVALALISFSAAQGPQPCYNAADPDGGIGNYCSCADGSCWNINPDGHSCDPTGTDKYPSCP
ncbi:uncharacterized protein LY89DRAFT_683920 [Mollisia scopiformis]|uniref:Uncharacterized protein n=1 Tax=Mollisia scopiformis TaxID=149040 RepID=A0A194XDV9_MOLSC|nr:uncharacterized protein LY89DRAFT_683920 [Mollisia scopiformis]KUJ17932.1 hypothetical protein LY89DRAFT_683920 [Mollisia scopiformis]